ncbi:TPA: hypothetical protein ACU21S_000878 [Mannheimia haemolytica]
MWKLDFSQAFITIFLILSNLLFFTFPSLLDLFGIFDIIFPNVVKDEAKELLFIIILSFLNLSCLLSFVIKDNGIVNESYKSLLKDKFAINSITTFKIKYWGWLYVVLNIFLYPMFQSNWRILISNDILKITSVNSSYFDSFNEVTTSLFIAIYIIMLHTIFSILIFIFKIFQGIFLDIGNGRFKSKHKLIHIFQTCIFIINILFFYNTYHNALYLFDENKLNHILIETSYYDGILAKCKSMINKQNQKNIIEDGFSYLLLLENDRVSIAKRNEDNSYVYALGNCSNNGGSYDIVSY